MSVTLEMLEERPMRQTQYAPNGDKIYTCFYNVPRGSELIPAEGDMMHKAAYDILGPYVMTGGVSWQQQRGGAKEQLVVRYTTLRARS